MAPASEAPGTLSVAVCQFAPGADRDQNRRGIAAMTADAAARGAELVVFPEYSSYFVAQMDESLAQNAEPLEGDFTAHLRQIAAQHSLTIVAGMVEEGEGRLVRNTAVAVDATGILARHRKQHLYDAFGYTESDWVEPGELSAPEVFALGGFTIGLMTCYDLRFPEVARTLADAGADAIIVPADWIRGPVKEHNWQTLLAARAIENTAYVLAADHPVPTGIGHSRIIDPVGLPLAAVGTEEGIALARLERSEIERVRAANPVLRLRRYRVTPG